jgi:hypothetical protein
MLSFKNNGKDEKEMYESPHSLLILHHVTSASGVA